MNGNSSNSCTGLLGELFMEIGYFSTISTATLSKEELVILAKILLVSCAHRAGWSNMKSAGNLLTFAEFNMKDKSKNK